jgi:uncharacterized protein (TIGR03067 family)
MKPTRAMAAVCMSLLSVSPFPAQELSATRGKSAGLTVQAVNKDVVALMGNGSDIELRDVSPARLDQSDEKYPGLHGGITGVSGSGLGTHRGTIRPPIHFATVIDQASGKKMKLLVQLASSNGFINRSAIGWDGDHIPGLRAAGRMYDRQMKEGSFDRMTAVLHLALPGSNEIHLLFVGYDFEGKQLAAFGRKAFGDYVSWLDAREQDGKKDLANLQGTWAFESKIIAGKETPKSALKAMTMKFEQSRFLIQDDDRRIQAGRFTLDPTQKPKRLDLTISEGEDQSFILSCIYQLQGDELKICRDGSRKGRPRQFDSHADSALILIVLKRTNQTSVEPK